MVDQIKEYAKLIKKFNPVLNLISPKDIHAVETKHISDAEESFRIFMDIFEQPNGYSVFDLGSGNGTPGIVWAILNPRIQHTMVEIDQRKAEFIRHCIRELAIPNASVGSRDFKTVEYPDNTVITARAFMNLNKLFEKDSIALGYPCFLLKGSTWNNELDGIEDLDLRAYPYKLKDGTQRTLIQYTP